jgi:arabinofuranosyltransferase
VAEVTSVLEVEAPPAPDTHSRRAPGSGFAPTASTAPPAGPRRWELALFLYAPFLATATVAFASSADDPFITLRYAANLVHGDGPVFNAGQRVEGFTSPLHLLVAVVAYLLPFGHDLLKLKLASLAFGFLAVRQAGLLLYGLALPSWARRAGCLAVATSWIVAFASGNGLETSLAVWLLISLARRLVLDGPRRSPVLLFLLALAAVLARPDALLAVAFMAVVGLVVERPLALWRRAPWCAGAGVAAVGVAALGAIYFGSPVPNTYVAKNPPLGRALGDGWNYLVDSLQPGILNHFWASFSTELLIFQGLFLVVGIGVIVRRFPRCGYLVAVVVAQALFIFKSGGASMTGGRFVAPAVLPMTVVEVLGVVGAVLFVRRHVRPPVARVMMACVTAALVASSVFPLVLVHAPAWQITGSDDEALLRSGHYGPFSQIWTALPRDVRCLHAGQLVAATEVGYLGFERQDLRILDLRGLTDRAIAIGSPASAKFPTGVQEPDWFLPTSSVGRVILQDRPALIAIFDTPPQPSVLGGTYRLIKQSAFGRGSLSIYAPPGATSDRCR